MTDVFDIDGFTSPLAEDAPCGENLEYDPEFQALELSINSANWVQAQPQALALCERTRDLRIALHLTRASLHCAGFVGFANGLRLMAALLETHWEALYPELEDLQEGLPPTRLNLMATLGVRDSTSIEVSMVSDVREANFVELPGVGKFCYRDVLVSQGELKPPEGESAPDTGAIQGALRDADRDAVTRVFEAVATAIESLTRIQTSFSDQIGSIWAPDFTPLIEVLLGLQSFISTTTGLGVAAASTTPDASSPAQAQTSANSGPIQSRQDVTRVLAEVCDYFERTEPSSPVPLLIKRASRLVDKDFLDLLRDLSPDAINQIQNIAGIDQS